MSNWRPVAVLALVCVLIVAAGLIFGRYKERRNYNAQNEIMDIMKIEDVSARMLKLEEFVAKHSGEDIAYQVSMFLGGYYHSKNDNEKAVKFFSDVVKGKEGNLMQYVAIDALAPIYLDMGKYDDGANLYLDAAGKSNSPAPFLYKYKAAYTYQLGGQLDKAVAIYDELTKGDRVPEAVRADAEDQLLWIASTSS